MKLKKIITMGLAAIMAVSAMSISALACESPEDAVVEILSEDGENYIYLSEKDIENGNNTIVGYKGLIFKITESETEKRSLNDGIMSVFSVTSYNFAYNRTSLPNTNQTVSIYNSSATGEYGLSSNSQRFTNKYLLNEDNTAVEFKVYPGASYNNTVSFAVCATQVTTSPLYIMKPTTNNTYGIGITGLSNDWTLYGYINNQFGSYISGTVSFRGYN